MVADPTRRDLVERAARIDLVVSTGAERRKEAHYRHCMSRTMFVSFALETYGVLSARSDRFLVECAFLTFGGCAGSGPSVGLNSVASIHSGFGSF